MNDVSKALSAQLKEIERQIEALDDSIEALIEEADRKHWTYSDPMGLQAANLIAAKSWQAGVLTSMRLRTEIEIINAEKEEAR